MSMYNLMMSVTRKIMMAMVVMTAITWKKVTVSVLAANGDLPSLDRATEWGMHEIGNIATLILAFVCVGCLFRKAWAALITFVILAGLVFFIIGDPMVVVKAIKAIWGMVVA